LRARCCWRCSTCTSRALCTGAWVGLGGAEG
jgi:hypothetical protein